MNRRLRFILWSAKVCRRLSDWLDWCELRLLGAAQRRGWKPDEMAAGITLSARQHRERVQRNIDEVRSKMGIKP
jgi:hypothetical protein